MTLKLELLAQIAGTVTGANDIAAPTQTIAKKRRVTLTTGVGAGQADAVYADQITLAASAAQTLDLDGALEDAFGQAFSPANIKAIYLAASADNVNDVVIGGAASNAWLGPFADATDKLKIPPGGVMLLTAPGASVWPVTAGTGDQLKIANGGAGTGVTLDIILVGAG